MSKKPRNTNRPRISKESLAAIEELKPVFGTATFDHTIKALIRKYQNLQFANQLLKEKEGLY